MRTNLRNKLGMAVLLLMVAALSGGGVFGGVTLAGPAASLPPATACTGAGTGTATCNLWTATGSTALPDGAIVNVWGYVDAPGATLTQPGGPVLVVGQGDAVTVNLTNGLAEPSALLFDGLEMIPDTAGAAANGGTATYTFTAAAPGTYLYEAGLLSNAQHQVAMGLYGLLVVRPAGLPNQAYAAATTAFDDEAAVVLSEIDPRLNASADPSTFDMRNYAPRYRLINGKAYPATDPIPAVAGQKLLLRYVNAGLLHHSMATLGLRQTVIGQDGNALAYPHTIVAETIAPGETSDVLVTVPLGTPDGAMFALYEGSLFLYNGGGPSFGGMLTFLTAGAPLPPGPDTAGPLTAGVTVSPNPTNGATPLMLTASVSDATTGGNNVTMAEYFVDVQGTAGTGTAMSGAFGSVTVVVQATISTATLEGLPSGSHTFYVHGQDSLGNWGVFNSAALNLDKAGPTTTNLTVVPAATSGSVDVALGGTASDAASGNSNVVAAEYAIDGGTATAMTVNVAAPVASLSAAIPAATVAALSDGPHTISVRSQDALLNWGAAANVTLTVDKTAPTASSVTVENASNGTNPVIRVRAAFADTLSNIAAGEGYVDTDPGLGLGFPFVATDGVFNSVSENGYGDLPQTIFSNLAAGQHLVYARAKDAAGNWGSASSALLVLLSDNFERATSTFVPPWTATGGNPAALSITSGGAQGGTRKMSAAISGGASGYVQYNAPAAEPAYHARFYLNPNGYRTGNGGNPAAVTIFSGLNAGNTTIFQVQYRSSTNNNVGYQVRLSVLSAAGTTNGNWYAITNGWNAIEIAWGSGTSAPASLYTGGTLRQTLTGLNTSAYTLASVRLGPQGTLPNSGTVYIDSFVSTRTLYIGP